MRTITGELRRSRPEGVSKDEWTALQYHHENEMSPDEIAELMKITSYRARELVKSGTRNYLMSPDVDPVARARRVTERLVVEIEKALSAPEINHEHLRALAETLTAVNAVTPSKETIL